MSHQDEISKKSSAFTEAMSRMSKAVEALDDGAAARPPQQGGWSVAQIAWHVGTTNELLAGVITGEVPMAAPVAQDFTENASVFGALPERIETFPQLVPPAGVTRADALAKLRASEPRVLSAFQSLTPERAAGYTLTLPFGTMSMFQVVDFVTGHVLRHLDQVRRATASA